jgi:hypothetical protein
MYRLKKHVFPQLQQKKEPLCIIGFNFFISMRSPLIKAHVSFSSIIGERDAGIPFRRYSVVSKLACFSPPQIRAAARGGDTAGKRGAEEVQFAHVEISAVLEMYLPATLK